jgi:hypothetical protein
MLTSPKITGSSSATLDDADRLIEGIFEPPDGFVLAAIARKSAKTRTVVLCA